MTNDQKQIALSTGKGLITHLLSDIEKEINKIHLRTTPEEANEIFNICQQKISDLNSRIDQLKNHIDK